MTVTKYQAYAERGGVTYIMPWRTHDTKEEAIAAFACMFPKLRKRVKVKEIQEFVKDVDRVGRPPFPAR